MAKEPGRTSEQRRDSFRKRCSTLFSMARDISEEFDAHIAVVAISPAGESHTFGGPTVDSVLRTYLPGTMPPGQAPSSSPDAAAVVGAETAGEAAARVAGMKRDVEETKALVAEEWERLPAASVKIRAEQAATEKNNWWEVDVEALGEEELPVFIRALEKLKDDVQECIDAKALARMRMSMLSKKMRQQLTDRTYQVNPRFA